MEMFDALISLAVMAFIVLGVISWFQAPTNKKGMAYLIMWMLFAIVTSYAQHLVSSDTYQGKETSYAVQEIR